jgi:hypothetical protein
MGMGQEAACPFDSYCAKIPCMPGRLRFALLVLFASGSFFLFHVLGSSAQAAYNISLTTPDISSFPHLVAYLDVHNQTGEFVHGLTPQEVMMQENGVQVPVNKLVEEKPGVQLVVAITTGSSYGIRDATGTSRYEYLVQGLLAGTWASQPSKGDDLSLLTISGPQLTHSSDPSALLAALESFQPADSNASPNLEVLSSAMLVASDPTPRPGMERAILFITPPQSSDVSMGLQSILASANQQNIHIFVWLVAAQDVFQFPENDLLRNLADQTHAAFFAFSHEEPVPDLETLLEPLRYVYQLGYESQVASSGAQEVAAQVTIGNEILTSPTQVFEVNLQAPSLVILDAPSEIIRTFPNQSTPATASALTDLQPVEQPINIRATFPDGYARPLVSTRLYVDGTEAAENTSAPFDQLVWDLRPYTQEGIHRIRVEATDNLGWVGQSNEISIKIIVPSTTQEVVKVVSQKRFLVIGLTVLTSASILILVLIVGGRIRPKPYPGQARFASSGADKTQPLGFRERLRQIKDPVTQPVKIGSPPRLKDKSGRKGWMIRLPSIRHKAPAITINAYLVPLANSDEPTLSAQLPITTEMEILGSDPQKASLVITDPSIEAVHARISQLGKSFRIADAGSVAGTWVNYEQITAQGIDLQHADIIHLGRIGFRFVLSEPGTARKISVVPLEPSQ